MTDKPKRFLLTGGRSPIALELSRQLHRQGHEVFVADTGRGHVTRFSNAVTRYISVPSPRFELAAFIDALAAIIKHEKIDMLVPIFEEIMYVSSGICKFPDSCEVFCTPFQTLRQLHSKWHFVQKCKELGFDVPETTLILSQDDLEKTSFEKPMALKACFSRASQNMKRLFPGKKAPNVAFGEYNPWVAQEWLEGDKFCSYSVVRGGKVLAHTVYPQQYTVEGSSCINFRAIEHAGILAWVQKFSEKMNFTGQVAFDFIEVPERGLFSIECNPRGTSGLHLFHADDGIDRAFLGRTEELIKPKKDREKQIQIGMILYGWKNFNRSPELRPYFKQLTQVEDVTFDRKDIMPFVMQFPLFLGYWSSSKKLNCNIPAAFTYDMDWNGEPLAEICFSSRELCATWS
ncbi:MAG: ATP-grasp domain-containing protein [Chlamydiia bacterium]|nr:ATP-grasp domain-containing protein [Chlamydiia bacterium]